MADEAPETGVDKLAPKTSPMYPGSFGPVPEMGGGMTFAEVGNSGLRQWAGYVREEFLPQLVGRQGVRSYREMMDNSPIVGGIIQSIVSTMRKVEWRTEMPEDSPENQEAIDFADSLRLDMSETWEDTIVEALSMVGYGFSPLEIVYKRRNGPDPGGDAPASKYDDGKIGWRRLPLRGQDTLLKWFFGPNGQIEGLTQQPWNGPVIDIPIEKMLLFRPTQHKNNPEGRSVLRNAYRSYYFTKRIEEQEAILYERLNGIPVVRLPISIMNSKEPDAVRLVNEMKRIAVNLRIDEQMGLVLPSDPWQPPGGTGTSSFRQYDLELVTPTGGGRMTVNATETLNRHNVNIMISVLADFLQMGHESRGTQGLANVKTDMFFQAIEGYLNSMASVFNRYGLVRCWKLNGLPPETKPDYKPDLAQRVDLDLLSNFVLRLSQSGMPLFPNDDVQTALMDAAGLPDALDVDAESLQEMTARVGAENAPPPAAGGGAANTPFGKMILASMARRFVKGNTATAGKLGRRGAARGGPFGGDPGRFISEEDHFEWDVRKYRPDQSRDDWGRWTDEAGTREWGEDGKQLSGPTEAEAKAVAFYTDAGFVKINDSLRKGKVPDDLKDEVEELDKFTQRGTTEADAIVYRMVKVESAQSRFGSMTPGATIVDRGYMSAASSLWGAEEFVRNANADPSGVGGAGTKYALMAIKVPAGSSFGPAAPYATYNEKEVLLPRGTRLTFVSKDSNVYGFTAATGVAKFNPLHDERGRFDFGTGHPGDSPTTFVSPNIGEMTFDQAVNALDGDSAEGTPRRV